MSTTPDLLQAFLDEAWEAAVVFEQTPEFLAMQRHEPLVVMAHRLRGSAALYGFPQTANLGALLERILTGAPYYTDIQRHKVIEFAAQATACLIESLETIGMTGSESQVGLELGRLGAPKLVEALAAENPEAFQHSSYGVEETAAPEAVLEQGISHELQAFFKDNADFWEFFAPETAEHVELAAGLLSGMRDDSVTPEQIQTLFRSMHTIKGAAYSVGCKPIGQFAHKLEDLMVEVREGRQNWSHEHGSLLSAGVETINQMLLVAEGKNPEATKQLSSEVARIERQALQMLGHEVAEPLEAVAEPTQAEHTPAETAQAPAEAAKPSQQVSRGSVRVSLDKLDSLLNLAGETLVQRSRLELMLKRFEELDNVLENARVRLLRTTSDFETRYLNPRLQQQNGQTVGGPTTGIQNTQTTLGKTVSELFTELEFDRYDDLNILARSIGEMTSDLAEVRGSLTEQIAAFRSETEVFAKLSGNLRVEIGRARLTSIGRFYQRMQRQVQQVASQKPMELVVSGETIEIDSVLLDGLSEALIHLVNNAIIHGLEDSSEERVSKGKDPIGRLNIRTTQQRNTLVLEISDDGRGIDLEAVKQKALERGLRTAEQLETMSPEEAVHLIFLAGLSTASNVSDVAGRGVGMDAVANTIRRLRGELSVETRPGAGTTFRLRIPQNLVVSDILLLSVGGRKLAVPRESLVTLLTAPSDATELEYEESLIPIKTISGLLGLPKTAGQKEYALAVVEGRGELVALAADRFIGFEQALVKPLSAPLSELPHLVGATVDATGEVILVISPAGLLSIGNASGITLVETIASAKDPVLLVDDSLSVRKVVAQMLRKAGHQVVTAADGQEALELLEQQSFQAVITDLEMPRMSGFELLEEVRRRPSLSHLPVAMLTTRATSKHRDLALELGATAYLAKPADELELAKFLKGDE